jgi:serine/threonine protein kinase/DNA-binding winged helix-turn-helix (wHTH) protein/class 3 adenylate cyclase
VPNGLGSTDIAEMPQTVSDIFEFGPFHLDPVEHLLLREGNAVALTPKAFETLCVLVENAGHVLSKEELMNRVWPDTFVEETNLAQNISTLRKALGEREGGRQYIETVPKRGYRFVAPVSHRTGDRHSNLKADDPTSTRQTDGDLSNARTRGKGQDTLVERVRETGSRIRNISTGMNLGHYEILERIGAGGMGEVYLARDRNLDRKVALKLLAGRFKQDERSLKRFLREARAVSALNHPNILTVHEIREVDGFFFIAMEFVEGSTLRQMLATGPLTPRAALDIAIQVAGALSAAHRAGIVHRDIKPENIMLRPDGYVKLLDFGVAKLILQGRERDADAKAASANGETDAGLILGTVDYMSPEQARALPIDARSDIFSLGAVLYEVLTGQRPFAAETKSDVLINVIKNDPRPALEIAPNVGIALSSLIQKALHKERDSRITSADRFQAELKQLRSAMELPSHSGDDLSSSGSSSSARSVLDSAARTPEVKYARSGEVNIAYQVVGDAPLDLVFVMGWVSHLEYFWADPLFARFLSRLASFSRLILFDKRGTGLSDRVPLNELPTLEQRMDDVRAVMEAVGSKHAVLCGISEGGPLCSLFAATYPEKVSALVMIGTYAKRIWAPDYPWAPTDEQRQRFFEEIRQNWGGPVGLEARAPSVANDPRFREWWGTYLRMGASPGAALALTQMNAEIDVRQVFPTIRVPTLILHRTGDRLLSIEEGRYVANSIPGAKLVELPGEDHLPFVGDQESMLGEIEEFLTGVRHSADHDTVLATVLATDIPDPDAQERVVGAERWRSQMSNLYDHVRREIELFKGREIQHSQGKTLATFDGPARAIRAAVALSAAASRLGIGLQVGLHTGECDVVGDLLGGMAIDICREVARVASVGEVVVSSTVKDLVAGSGLGFAELGSHQLAGVPGAWRIFRVLH